MQKGIQFKIWYFSPHIELQRKIKTTLKQQCDYSDKEFIAFSLKIDNRTSMKEGWTSIN